MADTNKNFTDLYNKWFNITPQTQETETNLPTINTKNYESKPEVPYQNLTGSPTFEMPDRLFPKNLVEMAPEDRPDFEGPRIPETPTLLTKALQNPEFFRAPEIETPGKMPEKTAPEATEEIPRSPAADPAMKTAMEEVAKETEPGQPMDRQALLEAYQDARRRAGNVELVGGLGQAADTIARAIASGYGGQVEKSDRMAQAQKTATGIMKDYDVEMRKDSESALSKTYQDIAKELAPSMADRIDKMSADELTTFMPVLQGISAGRIKERMAQKQMAAQERRLDRQEARELRREEQRQTEEERRSRTARLNAARGLLKDDPRYKKSIDQAMEFEAVEVLLDQMEKGNPTALAQLGTKMARAMGEVGVLTDSDVVRYVQGRPWKDQLMSWWKGGAEGKLPDNVAKGLTNSLSSMRNKLSGDTKSVYETAKNRLQTTFEGMDDKEAYGLLGYAPREVRKPASTDKQSTGPYGKYMQRSDGSKYEWDENMGKYIPYKGQ